MPSGGDVGVLGRKIWLIGCTALAVLGVAAALLFVGVWTAVLVFFLPAAVVWSVYLSVACTTEQLSRRLLREAARWALRAGLAVLAVCGYAASVGLATLPLVLLVAATVPVVLRGPESRPETGSELPTQPAGLSDEELCAAWQRSFVRLSDSSPVNRAAVVALRAQYLDELERRHPQLFADWLPTMSATRIPRRL